MTYGRALLGLNDASFAMCNLGFIFEWRGYTIILYLGQHSFPGFLFTFRLHIVQT